MKNFNNFKNISSRKQFDYVLSKFLPFCQKELNIKKLPKINFIDKKDSIKNKCFGYFKNNEIYLNVVDRHPIDILRTLAHELTHYTQNLNPKIKFLDGSTGSRHENMANIKAGIILRNFNSKYPELFKMKPIK